MTTKNKRIVPFMLAALAMLAWVPGPSRAEGMVAVLANSAAKSLSANHPADLFPGRSNEPPGTGVAPPIHMDEGTAWRDECHARVTSSNAGGAADRRPYHQRTAT